MSIQVERDRPANEVEWYDERSRDATRYRASDLWLGLPVIAALPDSLHPPVEAHSIFLRLAGARIVRIGTPVGESLEGGGLVLDYVLEGDDTQHRLVMAFNELGMWVVLDSLESDGGFATSRALSAAEIRALMSDQR
jgi:hypothetical protein